MLIANTCKLMLVIGISACLTACGGSGGGGVTPPPSAPPPVTPPVSSNQPYTDPVVYTGGATASLPSANEMAAITHHQITLNGKVISYTATTGHLTASNPKTGAPEASFFYVAYTADNQNASTRPLTIFLNGGPGNSQVDLNLGSFGPRRIVNNIPSLNEPATPQIVDNADSMLDMTDMVFVDMVGVGYSEAIAPNTNATFWGIDPDASVFTDFVTRYVNVNLRVNSPTFLYGFSYGTARASVMAGLMSNAGMKLSGIVLNSSILNYNTNCYAYDPSLGIGSCNGALPSYAATGAYYQLDNPNPTDLTTYLQQVRSFDASTFTPAVTAYVASNTPPSATLITELTNYTGIGASVWQSTLNLSGQQFSTMLLPGQVFSLYDTRVAVPVSSPIAANGQDPAGVEIGEVFGNAFAGYLSGELQYNSNSAYGNGINFSFASWPHTHNGSQIPDVVPDLQSALAKNSALPIISLNGYYELVTPFYQTELDLARLGTNANIQIQHYPAGHVTFLDNTARPMMKADIVSFFSKAP